MAEVIGTLSAVFQLAGACVSLLELLEKIKNSPKVVKRFQAQVSDLYNLCEEIQSNKILHKAEVTSHTSAITSLIERARPCSNSLARGGLYKVFALLRQERDLAELSIVLEKEKTTLSIRIQNIQLEVLSDIRCDIKNMNNNNNENMNNNKTFNPSTVTVAELDPSRRYKPRESSEDRSGLPEPIQQPALNGIHSLYRGNSSTNADQINGPYFKNVPYNDLPCNTNQAPTHYEGNTASVNNRYTGREQTSQYNGAQMEDPGPNPEHKGMYDFRGIWDKQHNGEGVRQVNGPSVLQTQPTGYDRAQEADGGNYPGSS